MLNSFVRVVTIVLLVILSGCRLGATKEQGDAFERAVKRATAAREELDRSREVARTYDDPVEAHVEQFRKSVARAREAQNKVDLARDEADVAAFEKSLRRAHDEQYMRDHADDPI